MRLNLGCGDKRMPGWRNVDKIAMCNPDEVVDLERLPWPWPDDSVEEILLSHVLEHIGQTPDVYLGIIKEIYRVCRDGAKITIVVPHPRHDHFLQDPTHVRVVTPEGLNMFSQAANRRLIAPAGPNRSTRRNRARLLCVISEAQYQAFVRFAVASGAALSAIALNRTCLLEPLPGRALLREFWRPAVKRRGEPTLNRCCNRKVVSPRGYSKRFFAPVRAARPAFARKPPVGYRTGRFVPDPAAPARRRPSVRPPRRSGRSRPLPPASRPAPAMRLPAVR